MATNGVEEVMKIVVKSPKDKRDITIAKNANVKQLKDIITKEFSAELEQLCLIYAGKILKDTDHLGNYGIKEGTTVHLVIKSVNKGQDSGAGGQQGSAAAPQIDIGATPFGLGGLGGLLGLGNLGFGSANFMDLQGRMQREMFTNPNMLQSLMNNPMVQQLMANPTLLQSLLSANPQIRELLQGSPEIARVLENPELLQQAAGVAQNPAMLQELMRNSAFAENFGGGQGVSVAATGAASGASSDGAAGKTDKDSAVQNGGTGVTAAGMQSMMQQMMQNPQLMTNIMQAPYMQSMLQNLASNPQIIEQYMGNTQLVPGDQGIQDSMRDALPFLSQQLANPDVQSLVGNPRALQAMMDIQQGMQQLQNEAPTMVGDVRSGSNDATAAAAPVTDGTNTPSSSSGQLTSPPADQYSSLLRQMFGMMSGAATTSTQPPEVRFQVQLTQLAQMGFGNKEKNIVALTATSGDLNAAVDQLLQDG